MPAILIDVVVIVGSLREKSDLSFENLFSYNIYIVVKIKSKYLQNDYSHEIIKLKFLTKNVKLLGIKMLKYHKNKIFQLYSF